MYKYHRLLRIYYMQGNYWYYNIAITTYRKHETHSTTTEVVCVIVLYPTNGNQWLTRVTKFMINVIGCLSKNLYSQESLFSNKPYITMV